MAQFETTPATVFTTPYSADERVSSFLRSVYGWMFVGLGITALVALMVASSPSLVIDIAGDPVKRWGLLLAQLGIVLFLSLGAEKLSAAVAGPLFLFYSALTGVTMSFVVLAYSGESIATTFFVTAGMFGAMAIYGTVTRRSLAGWGQFLFMGLVGVLLASVVGMFVRSEGLQFVLSFIGVIVFTGLAAYDAQRMKAMALTLGPGQLGTYSVVGALILYLDFINLFLKLLRFLGNRRN
jgi:FtsH-binding integral membrane protein